MPKFAVRSKALGRRGDLLLLVLGLAISASLLGSGYFKDLGLQSVVLAGHQQVSSISAAVHNNPAVLAYHTPVRYGCYHHRHLTPAWFLTSLLLRCRCRRWEGASPPVSWSRIRW